jgi:hypothetical protein
LHFLTHVARSGDVSFRPTVPPYEVSLYAGPAPRRSYTDERVQPAAGRHAMRYHQAGADIIRSKNVDRGDEGDIAGTRVSLR